MTARHILALGGGGFLGERDNPLLDDYALELTGASSPRVCFVPTASGDSDAVVAGFYAAFPWQRCRASHLPLFARIDDPAGHLLEQDLIYVGGGNTANLLALWRLHGVDAALRQAWEAGVVLAGMSAGSICWFENGVTDSFGRHELTPIDGGLGILAGSNCPHYDSEPLRRPTYTRLVAEGRLPAGLATEEGVGLHFEGTELTAVVASRPGAAAYRVERSGDEAVESRLEARFLG